MPLRSAEAVLTGGKAETVGSFIARRREPLDLGFAVRGEMMEFPYASSLSTDQS